MTILNRYVVRLLLIHTVLVVSVFFALFICIDFVTDMDEFTQAARVHASRWGGQIPAFFAIVFDYYVPMGLMLFTHLAGVSVAVAAGFTAIHMQRSRELIGIVSSGISLRRLAIPFFLTAAAVNLLVMPIQEYILPPLAAKAVRGKTELKASTIKSTGLQFVSDGQDLRISCARFEPDLGRMEGVNVLRQTPSAPIERWDADAATWDGSGWVFDPPAEVRVLEIDGGLPRKAQKLTTTLGPEMLRVRQNAKFGNLLSFRDLRSISTHQAFSESARANYARAAVERWLGPWMNAMLILLVLPFLLTRTPHLALQRSVFATGLTLAARAFILAGPMILPFTPVWAGIATLLILMTAAMALIWRMET